MVKITATVEEDLLDTVGGVTALDLPPNTLGIAGSPLRGPHGS